MYITSIACTDGDNKRMSSAYSSILIQSCMTFQSSYTLTLLTIKWQKGRGDKISHCLMQHTGTDIKPPRACDAHSKRFLTSTSSKYDNPKAAVH